EVRKRLRPLALQATAAERAEKLKDEIASVEARLAELELEELGQAAAEIEERRTAATLARKAANGKLEDLLVERNRAEDDLADAAGRREEATAALYRLRSAADRLELRREAAESLAERLRADPSAPALSAHDERLRTTKERLDAIERALAEREGLPPAARALAEEGAPLALSELEVAPGSERAVAAALGPRGSALLADDAAAALGMLERACAAGLGNLTVLIGARPAELVERYAVVPKEELLGSTVPAVTAEGFGYDPQRGEIWFAGET